MSKTYQNKQQNIQQYGLGNLNPKHQLKNEYLKTLHTKEDDNLSTESRNISRNWDTMSNVLTHQREQKT